MESLTDQPVDARKRLQFLVQSRKSLETGKAALSNRLGFLRMEDQKTLKDIEATKKQAQMILQRRLTGAEETKTKQENVIRAKAELLQKYTTVQTHRLHKLKESAIEQYVGQEKLRRKASAGKIEKKENLQVIQNFKQKVLAEKKLKAQTVKSARSLSLQRRASWQELKIAKTKQETNLKWHSEVQKRKQTREKVVSLEAEELVLIERLKNSQETVQFVNAELERAMTVPLT